MQLGDKEFWDRLAKDPKLLAAEVCTVDLVNLEDTLQKHPALRAWVNAAHEGARIREERFKWEVTKASAIALLRAKKKKDPDTDKPKTLAVLEAEVIGDRAVQTATKKLHDIQEERAALRAMATALEDRKDMLIQIAARHRKEMSDYQ
ncbi:hypothetical protein LCGC14_3167000 [marine sediment metagenome]|uniref:Uncharacterized protein n=1 Tax=marine sediment metagenome TaxID=412755 RepID=A0A0F8W8X2_9ZZZZ